MITSGAGALLVVESEEHARGRGARVRGSVLACQHRIGAERGASPTAFDPRGFSEAVDLKSDVSIYGGFDCTEALWTWTATGRSLLRSAA